MLGDAATLKGGLVLELRLDRARMSLPRFRGHLGYAARGWRRQSASASFGLRYWLRECSLLAL